VLPSASGGGAPSINLLLDALEQAAAGRLATIEFCRKHVAATEGKYAGVISSVGGGVWNSTTSLSALPLDVGASAAAYSLCVHAFESLLAVWLAHAAMDGGLRFEAADVAAFSRKAAIASALDVLPFASAVVKQLRGLGC
jgi:hypothetical protein